MKNNGNSRTFLWISSFLLKVFALTFMTIDHTGVLLTNYYTLNDPLIYIMRSIGRMAFPIFCLLSFESTIKTKHFGKYMLKLGILLTFVSISLLVINAFNPYNIINLRNLGNIFIDLMLGSLLVYLLNQKKIGLKFLAIIPFGIAVASHVSTCLENSGTYALIKWYPYFLRTQYGVFGVTIFLGFYVAYLLTKLFAKEESKRLGLDEAGVDSLVNIRLVNNIFNILIFSLIAISFRFLGLNDYIFLDLSPLSLYALFSGIFMFFYNGKRGYSKPWFTHGAYLYYPLHIGILILIYLIFMS